MQLINANDDEKKPKQSGAISITLIDYARKTIIHMKNRWTTVYPNAY